MQIEQNEEQFLTYLLSVWPYSPVSFGASPAWIQVKSYLVQKQNNRDLDVKRKLGNHLVLSGGVY